MKTKDLKSLLMKLNNHLVRNFDTATGLGIKFGHYQITVEHILIAVMEDGQGDVPLILKHYNVDPAKVQKVCQENVETMDSGNPGKPIFSPLLTDLLQEAWIASSVHHQEVKIRSGTLFEVFLDSTLSISTGVSDLVNGINHEDLRNKFYDIVKGSLEDVSSSVEALPVEDARKISPDASTLDLYTINLTQEAKDGKIDPILGRDNEIIQLIEILSKKKKSNPILLGEPGVGKTAIVEGLALKIAAGEVPDMLEQVQVHSLDLGALQAGTKMRGEFEKRLKAVINDVIGAAKPVVMFIDEAHTLIGAGAAEGGGDAANLLKPALARGEFRAIAATTYLEYNKYFATDAALERRFLPVHIGEPDNDKAMLMLRGIKKSLEKHHGIHISDAAITASVTLSRRYIAGRQLPDKAVDLLDTSATRVKMSLSSKPPQLILKSGELYAINKELESLQKDITLGVSKESGRVKTLESQRTEREKEIKDDEKRWKKELELVVKLIGLRKTHNGNAKADEIGKLQKEIAQLQGEAPQVFAEVTAGTVAEVIEAWTGIPVSDMTRDEIAKLMNLEDELRKRVVGQDHAIKQISDVIRSSKVGLQKEEGPIGVFLFVGSSGVGKTELARAVAEVLFGDERFMLTLNMTEYQNESNTSRLIGADPGLVGFGKEGALCGPVRRRPYSVVLLDEIEKANPAVVDIFMQVFDRGMLKDSDSRDINFSNTIIFMTSNLASDVLFEKYNNGMTAPEDLLEELRPYLNRHFRPEFLGRLKPIAFLPLAPEVMKRIVKLKLGKMADRLQQNQSLKVEFDGKVIDEIVDRCSRAETGARNIDAIMDKSISPSIATELLGYMAKGESPSKLKVGRNAKGEFSYKFT